jgi:hypothetical protein
MEEANLGKSGFVSRGAGNAARLALEKRALILIDYFRGNAVHHHQRIYVRAEGLNEGGSERFVRDMADFDE